MLQMDSNCYLQFDNYDPQKLILHLLQKQKTAPLP